MLCFIWNCVLRYLNMYFIILSFLYFCYAIFRLFCFSEPILYREIFLSPYCTEKFCWAHIVQRNFTEPILYREIWLSSYCTEKFCWAHIVQRNFAEPILYRGILLSPYCTEEFCWAHIVQTRFNFFELSLSYMGYYYCNLIHLLLRQGNVNILFIYIIQDIKYIWNQNFSFVFKCIPPRWQ